MKISKFIEIVESMAPTSLKESYDNVGLMVGDRNSDVSKILLALDCTMDVIREAKEKGAQLIFTHHPLLYIKPKTITTDTLQGKKIIELIKNDINLYSAHTNLDSAKGGVNDSLMSLLGINEFTIMEKSSTCESSGIGRIAEVEDTTLGCMIDKVKNTLNVDTIRYSGSLESPIRKIAVINGSGQDYFSMAVDMGADLIITGDTTYHYVSDYSEMGVSIIDAGHFDTEWLSFLEASKKIFDTITSIDDDVEFIVSTSTKNPYEFI